MNWSCQRWLVRQQVKPDDHSEVVPLLPIPNRTVKRLCADDSADSRVKVGHCQAIIQNAPVERQGRFTLGAVFPQILRSDDPSLASAPFATSSVSNSRRQ